MKQLSAIYGRGGASTAPSRRWISLAMVAGLALLSTGCAKLKSRDQMNQGVQAYRNSHYAEAANHFKEAVQLDPTNQNAMLYLATSYMTQWVPGAQSADNKKNLDMAQQTFQQVLEKDPNNSLALASMASMSFNTASSKPTDQEKAAAMEDTRKWNVRRIQADPKDAEAYYYLGVIDYSQSNPAIRAARLQDRQELMKAAAKKKGKQAAAATAALRQAGEDNTPIKDDKARGDLKDKYANTINDGISNLHKALDIDNENEDAMSYLGLLLRSKAALEDTPDAAHTDVAEADKWADKSLATKRMKATRPKKAEQAS